MPIQNPEKKCNALSWRDHLPIHPAAELFPLMAEVDPAALKELAEDIKKHGLRTQIVLWTSKNPEDKWEALLDGRNRLDAAALAGLLCVDDYGRLSLMNGDGTPFEIRWRRCDDDDPYAIALSYNIHRRHLTSEQKRELIAKVLKAKPEASNLQIAKQVKADDKTVAKVRADLERRSEIPNVKARTDTKGRKQPAGKPKKTAEDHSTATDLVETRGDDGVSVWSVSQPEVSVEQRRAEMAALAVATEELEDEPKHKVPSANGSQVAADEIKDRQAPANQRAGVAVDHRELLRIVGVDPAKLTASEIKTASELVRRISQCERVPGSNKRRPAATEAWQAFLAAHPDAQLRNHPADGVGNANEENATPKSVKEINAFHSEAIGFLQDFTQRLRAWCAARPLIDKDGKAALMQALYLCADGFAHLAQELDGRPDLVVDDLSIPDFMQRGTP